MSKIAEALAKAKEKTGHTTAPFGGGQSGFSPEMVAKKEEALRRAYRVQRLRLALSSVALVLTMFFLWTRLKDEDAGVFSAKPAEEKIVEAVKPVVAQLTAPEPEPVRNQVATDAPVAVFLPTESSDGASASAVAPRPDLQMVVNDLVFSAVIPGERPRLMYKGRIVGPGDKVESELVFAGLHDGRLVFNDERGAMYFRRY